MQRWQLTTGLAGAAVLAALVVPSIRGVAAGTTVASPAPPAPTPAPPVPDVLPGGLLNLEGDLDQGAVLVGQGDERFLVFEISAEDLPGDVRRPVNLSVVIDTSGSMAGAGKITQARAAAAELAGILRPQDTLSLVTFDDRGRVRVEAGPVHDLRRFERTLRGIQPDGGTNLYDGLQLGLQQLAAPSLEGVKRVILLSDGQANVGVTDAPSLARLAGSAVADGVTVSGLGLGLDYNEDLLAAMSDSGGGSYRFVDRPGQLAQLFTEELHQMTAVAGREAALDVLLPEGVALQEVYGWDSAVTKDGYRVFLGDVHGGERRKVVARVTVTADAPTADLEVATATLTWTDPETDARAGDQERVAVAATQDRRVAERSVDKPAAAKAAQAVSANYVDKAIRAYEKGDAEEQRANFAAASTVLRGASTRTGDASLAEAATDFEDLDVALERTDNRSDEGLFQIKKRKESARVLSR